MADTFNSSLSLVWTIILFAGLALRCIAPPNPNTSNGWKNDRLGFFATSTFTNMVGAGVTILYILHATIVYAWSSNSPWSVLFCPHPERLNPSLFNWNMLTAFSLFGTILLGAPLRISAYADLGQDFTYGLAAPNKLTTSGIYRYMQHPSYSGLIIVVISSFSVFLRWDGAVACWLPAPVHDLLNGWGVAAYALVISAFGHQIVTRIHDEEAMLKEIFGDEWAEWHSRTARFIPFVL